MILPMIWLCWLSSQLLPSSSAFSVSTLNLKTPRGTMLTRPVSVQSIQEEIINGFSDGTSRVVSAAITPYQILFPEAFSSVANGSDRAVPLYACLQMLQQALDAIVKGSVDVSNIVKGDTGVIRLEHTVSHYVDPLCWLHAQTRRETGEPTVYFANAEQTLEVAVYGSAHSHRGATSDAFWKMVGNLPQGSLVFGGERFDRNTKPSEEWKDFGEGLWILPSVELRKTSLKTVDNMDGYEIRKKGPMATTIAIHLCRNAEENSWKEAAQRTLPVLSRLSDAVSDAVPPTTLPPVISRESNYGPDLDGQEIYERGVTAALSEFEKTRADGTRALEKVVLARRMDLSFDRSAQLSALDIVRKWKFGGHEGGHLFYLHPGRNAQDEKVQREFFGCSPERLFQIQDGLVVSEALAGTRPRGSTLEIDTKLSRELVESPKDREENLITGRFIRSAFQELNRREWITAHESTSATESESANFFVRRLRHLQHICQRFAGKLQPGADPVNVSRFLLQELHPTPAVCGYPRTEAMRFIRRHEALAFDRGFYAGPFGCFGRDKADIVVAIRSGLATRAATVLNTCSSTSVSVFAGAGIVPGSTVQGEWAETSYKLGVVSSLFPQAPMTLQHASTPNVAWATAFIEELIRCGVTQFYVCPGSRSTPLVAALAKALRTNLGAVYALSVHDERGAAFRALGYGRGANRPAAVITSSGTAIANLYPAIMEAGMDGVPLLILTADRPYENRATGANQSVDQVKAFSSAYIRWFRDIPPPSDEVPVSLAFSDAGHAVTLSRRLRGPVHLNIQFRENLAPDAGPIRNDDRVDSLTSFNRVRFTDIPGFHRWSAGGGRWMKSFSVDGGTFSYDLSANGRHALSEAIDEVARLIRNSKRGIIVVGNIRRSTDELQTEEESQVAEVISNFAQSIGFPIIAGVQSNSLRSCSPAVIPFAEHVLKHPTVARNINPDFVLQIGSPLVSTEIQKMIVKSMKSREQSAEPTAALLNHVLLHPHHADERTDPDFTISHRISAEIGPFLKALVGHLETLDGGTISCKSDLAPLVVLGRKVQERIPEIIHDASRIVTEQFNSASSQAGGEAVAELTEPQVVLALAEIMGKFDMPMSLFLSNSMPVRNSEFFLYPLANTLSSPNANSHKNRHAGVSEVGVNRGASGIDGIISTASGFAEATDRPTTLLVGDLAALHDINALHTLSTNGKRSSKGSSKRSPQMTTIVVNNDGGGIFSFLPIAQHGNDVNFDEFFGTPTNSFSFEKGAEAFGLKFLQSSTYNSFVVAYMEALSYDLPCIIEAKVAGREANVAVHREISRQVNTLLDDVLEGDGSIEQSTTKIQSPFIRYKGNDIINLPLLGSTVSGNENEKKTLVLLHGWMGEKSDWDDAGDILARSLPSNWVILSIDLPGHGESSRRRSADMLALRSSLGLRPAEDGDEAGGEFSIDEMAASILRSLSDDHGINTVNALAGYSLGGRVALAMKRSCHDSPMINDETKLILLSSNPGVLPSPGPSMGTDSSRTARDDKLADEMISLCNRACLRFDSASEKSLLWSNFLHRWYSSSIWANLQHRDSQLYSEMLNKRIRSLSVRGQDIAAVLQQCSPARHSTTDWQSVNPENTLYVTGDLDSKFSGVGKKWSTGAFGVNHVIIPDAGHALLAETSPEIAGIIHDFLVDETHPKPVNVRDKRDDSTVKQQYKDVRANYEDRTNGLKIPDAQWKAANGKSTESTENELGLAGAVGSLDFEHFAIDFFKNENRKETGAIGIGWGERAKANEANRVNDRSGLILHVVSSDGSAVGVGEVSPLAGLHTESLSEAEGQLTAMKERLQTLDPRLIPKLDVTKVLSMDGALADYIESLMKVTEMDMLSPSVRSGLEMALLSLASQIARMPVLQALLEFAPDKPMSLEIKSPGLLPLNGLIMRGHPNQRITSHNTESDTVYPSLKVKVGHQASADDAMAMSRALQGIEKRGRIRADANRAWDETSAIDFAGAIESIDVDVFDRLEFIEEPLKKTGENWTLEKQVQALDRWHDRTGIKYALDESLADLAEIHRHDFDAMRKSIIDVFFGRPHGCAAIVLKPALLGLELSMRLARLAHKELGIGAVFSSSFDSGVGLAYTAFLASASDNSVHAVEKALYPHGVGTFVLLDGDTLSPSFGSYVTDRGQLKVSSLSRAFFGLSLDEMRDSFTAEIPEDIPASEPALRDYQASTATSSSGREISVVVSLPLPFSDDIACSRFADLPQQSRWSPWLSSVAYLDAGRETEWTLNVRGVRFSWRAVSSLLDKPYRGILWESISGLKNMGVVEFIPTSSESCMMKVRMTIVTPRIVATLFPGASIFAEDFLQNKLLKWSLEMFRDVVKGDLALERGDVELGDALFGAVEGRANAIEATLSNQLPVGEVPSNPDETS